MLVFEVYDYDSVSKDDFMGFAELAMNKLTAEASTLTLELQKRSDKDEVSGSIEVNVSLESATAAAVDNVDPVCVAWEKEKYISPSYVNVFGASMDGWLQKQPTNSKIGAGKKWEDRYFAINHNILYYFKASDDHDSKGFIQLSKGTEIVDEADHDDRSNCLTIQTQFVSLNLSAPDAETKNAWIEALKADVSE
eukprot:TRINITY_DN6095_c0_g1_i5.p1 TRINITY_DN6095_c0_g1~~TRINITY_DN6095_c0_g1_i5.p1  ORF type:complete len:194 (-),score=66.01 TRINITY_DN6095_c0_g1_i5:194-775(-)